MRPTTTRWGSGRRTRRCVDPVNRCQSPISTASPNAVSVEIPRRQPSRCTTAVNSLSAAIASIACIEPVPPGDDVRDGFVVGLERQLPGGVVEPLPAQPRVMRPVHACPPDQTMPCRSSSLLSRCRARIRSLRASSRARTRSRAASACLLGTVTATRSPCSSRRASSAHPGHRSSPDPRGTQDLARRRDHAAHLTLSQEPGQAEPGRPGLVRDRDRPGQLLQPPPDILSSGVNRARVISPVAASMLHATTERASTSSPTNVRSDITEASPRLWLYQRSIHWQPTNTRG